MGEALKRAGFEKVSRRRDGSSPVYVYKIRKILPCSLLDSYSRVCSIVMYYNVVLIINNLKQNSM